MSARVTCLNTRMSGIGAQRTQRRRCFFFLSRQQCRFYNDHRSAKVFLVTDSTEMYSTVYFPASPNVFVLQGQASFTLELSENSGSNDANNYFGEHISFPSLAGRTFDPAPFPVGLKFAQVQNIRNYTKHPGFRAIPGQCSVLFSAGEFEVNVPIFTPILGQEIRHRN